jgi:hypothetical protein
MSAAGLPAGWNSRALWGLRDVLELNARAFYIAVTNFQHLMDEAKEIGAASKRRAGEPEDDTFREPLFEARFRPYLLHLREQMVILNARLAIMSVDHLLKALSETQPSRPALGIEHFLGNYSPGVTAPRRKP